MIVVMTGWKYDDDQREKDYDDLMRGREEMIWWEEGRRMSDRRKMIWWEGEDWWGGEREDDLMRGGGEDWWGREMIWW